MMHLDTSSLTRDGIVHDMEPLDFPLEWEAWADASSPHARVVWRSHFPAILKISMWYALTMEDIRASLKFAVWGVGVKGYPRQWWLSTLRKFFHTTTPERVLFLRQLIAWVKQGKKHTLEV